MSGTPPSTVLKRDLRPEISEDEAQKIYAGEMSKFIAQVTTQNFTSFDETSTKKIVNPILDAMKLEGFY
jgi:hypothetical protein